MRPSLPVLLTLIVSAWGDRHRILEWVEAWPAWLKRAVMVLIGLITGLLVIWGLEMEWILLKLFKISLI